MAQPEFIFEGGEGDNTYEKHLNLEGFRWGESDKIELITSFVEGESQVNIQT